MSRRSRTSFSKVKPREGLWALALIALLAGVGSTVATAQNDFAVGEDYINDVDTENFDDLESDFEGGNIDTGNSGGGYENNTDKPIDDFGNSSGAGASGGDAGGGYDDYGDSPKEAELDYETGSELNFGNEGYDNSLPDNEEDLKKRSTSGAPPAKANANAKEAPPPSGLTAPPAFDNAPAPAIAAPAQPTPQPAPAPTVAQPAPAPAVAQPAPAPAVDPLATPLLPASPVTDDPGLTATPGGGDPTAMPPAYTQDVVTSPEPDVGPVAPTPLAPNEFAGAPPIPGARRVMAVGEAPEEYGVEPGDTLFDICDQLLDEPGYWPKLWSFNPEIQNPHFIYPGMKLRFYPGDSDTPPYLQIVSEDDMVPIDKDGLSESELVAQDISQLLLKDPVEQTTEFIGIGDVDNSLIENLFETMGSIYQPNSVRVVIPAFVFAEEKEELGTVLGGTYGNQLSDGTEEVAIKSDGSLSVGTTYTVLRKGATLKTPDDETVGTRYDFVSQIKILREEGDAFVGRVLLPRLGAEVGDILVSYISTQRSVPASQPTSGASASGNAVVGFEYPNKQIGGRGSYVLLDKSAGELSLGQQLQIFNTTKNTAMSFVRDSLPDIHKPVAVIQVIDTSSEVAVGYVMSDRREVRLGDTAGPRG